MKKFILLGLATFLVIVPGVRGQESIQHSDQEIQHKLTGTWVSSWGRGLTTTNVIAADGSFKSTTGGFTNGVVVGYQGTFLAKDGVVVGKAIIGKQTVNMRLHIIRLDSHELVWSNDEAVTESAFHKVGK
jgi:hypothetical protein